MFLRSGFWMLFVLAVGASDPDEDESAMRRARFSARAPSEVLRCLRGAFQVGCSAFTCLERSSCDTDGMSDVCNAFFNTAAGLNTEGKTFIKESIKCIVNGMSSMDLKTIQDCSTFQKMSTEVQEDCYRKLDLCAVAQSNPDVIGDVVQVPRRFPNRFYSTLLQSLMKCDENTVRQLRSSLLAKLDPDMDALIQLLEKKSCIEESKTTGQESFRWPLGPPVFRIQPNNKDPNHLFAKKR